MTLLPPMADDTQTAEGNLALPSPTEVAALMKGERLRLRCIDCCTFPVVH